MRCFTALILLSLPGPRADLDKPQDCDGEVVWTQLLVSKGGAAKLDAVDTLYVKEEMSYWQGLAKRRYELHIVSILPDYLWSWMSTGRIGELVSAVDYREKVHWHQGDGGKLYKGPVVSEKPIIRFQVLYLLQSKWMKPSIMGCQIQSDGRGSRETILGMTANGFRFELFIKENDSLPHRIEFHDSLDALDRYDLTNYREVAGIQFPLRMMKTTVYQGRIISRFSVQVQYEVNPEIAQGFRNRAPAVDAGPSAWRPKR